MGLLLMAHCCREVKALLHVYIPQILLSLLIFFLFRSFWTCSEVRRDSLLWAVTVRFPNISWKCNFVGWMWHCLLLYIWASLYIYETCTSHHPLFLWHCSTTTREFSKTQRWNSDWFRVTTVEDGAFWEALRCYAAYQSLVSAHARWVYSINIIEI